MLVPAAIKALSPASKVAWFLHVPFSGGAGFAALPVAAELLRGVLGADVVAFHTPASVAAFAAACAQLLPEARAQPTCVVLGGGERPPRRVALVARPIGIEPRAFEAVAASPACVARAASLRARFAGRRLVVSVDRLDAIKGIPLRLLGVEAYCAAHGAADVAFLQVSVPSREAVDAVRDLTRVVHELVGHVNARFGAVVHYLHGSVDATELCALYSAADALLVTSVADGFNLVALEFVAAQAAAPDGRKGALVLSEFIGCAQSLPAAELVNPFSANDIARGLHAALEAPAAARLERWAAQISYVRRATAAAWAAACLGDLA
jgi:trehalose-6-phosphate synthase